MNAKHNKQTHTEIVNVKYNKKLNTTNKYCNKHQGTKIVKLQQVIIINKFNKAMKILELMYERLQLTQDIMEDSFFQTTIGEIEQLFVYTGELILESLKLFCLANPLFLKLCHDCLSIRRRSIQLGFCLT